MQMHSLSRPLVPERWKIRRADQLVVWKLVQCPIKLQRFVRVESIDAAAAPGWQRATEPVAHAVLQFECRHLQPLDQRDMQQNFLQQANVLAALLGLLNHTTRRQPVIETARENELE